MGMDAEGDVSGESFQEMVQKIRDELWQRVVVKNQPAGYDAAHELEPGCVVSAWVAACDDDWRRPVGLGYVSHRGAHLVEYTNQGGLGWTPHASRLEARRAILRNRDMPVRRAADGGLVGWRVWVLDTWRTYKYTDQGPEPVRDVQTFLVSPHRGTTWNGPTLSAEVWSDEAAVEGHAGIHAALRPEPIQGTLCFSAMNTVTGRVRGYGRYVLGTRGWRAERVVIDYLRVPADVYDEVRGPLSERYQCDIRKQWR